MSAGKANCVVCGEPLNYFEEAREVTCHVCGKTELGHCVCVAGHYVCDACHRASGVQTIMDKCLASGSRDPVDLAQEIMADKTIYPNGPEHHTLVGAVLLATYRNAGGGIDLPAALDEMKKRSLQVPGGVCGFWGTCGAATSAGQFWSIVSGSTPMSKDAWAETQRLTSRILGKLADLGWPRCCKRTGFTAIIESAHYAQEVHGVQMDLPKKVECAFFRGNAECLKKDCPYFPVKAMA